MVWPLLPKILHCSYFFEPITTQSTQSQPSHVSISVHPMFAGLPNSLFFAAFGINTPSSKPRDGCKLLEPILVPLLNRFVHTSGTSRWWSGRSNLFCILSPAEKLLEVCPYRDSSLGYGSQRRDSCPYPQPSSQGYPRELSPI